MKRKIGIVLVCAALAVVSCACGRLQRPQSGGSGNVGNSVSQERSSSEERPSSEASEPQGESEYPVLEDTTDGITLAEVSDDKIYVQYPADGWAFDNSLAFTLYQDPDAQGRTVNVNVMVFTPWTGELTPNMVEPLKEQIVSTVGDGVDIQVMEMRSFCGAPIIYLETNTVLTNEMLDMIVAAGTITEEQITQMGGREAVLNGMSNKQIQIYAVVDDHILVYTGTYYEDESKQDVITTMETMIKTSRLL